MKSKPERISYEPFSKKIKVLDCNCNASTPYQNSIHSKSIIHNSVDTHLTSTSAPNVFFFKK